MADQSTPRLDGGDAAHGCPKCGQPMARARAGGVTLFPGTEAAHPFFAIPTRCYAWVCSRCGYTELYALDPGRFSDQA